MKKYLIGLLFVFLLFGCSQNINQQIKPDIEEEKDIKIMVATDLHYLSKKLYNLENTTFINMVNHSDGKMFHYSEEIINAFITQVIHEKPDVLLLTGDLTFNGELQSHLDLKDKLKAVEEHGITVLVIPGNHDFNQYQAYDFSLPGKTYTRTDNTTVSQFLDIYQEYGYDHYLSKDKESLSYSYWLSNQYRLLMIDVNGSSTYDFVSDQTLTWITQQLEEAKENQSETPHT